MIIVKSHGFLPLFRSLLCILLALPAPLLLAQHSTQGFLNQSRTETPGTLLSHPWDNDSVDIGRTTTVQYLRGYVIVGGEQPGSRSGSDWQGRVYDLEDPANPIRLYPSDFGHAYANDSWFSGNYGWNAHGSALVRDGLYPTTYKSGGDGGAGHAPLRVENWGGTVAHQQLAVKTPFGGWNRAAQAGGWLATLKWYGSANSDFTISKQFPNGSGGFTNRTLATFDHNGNYGGGDWHPMFFGDLLIYARSGSADSDGIVIYRLIYNDFDDPSIATVTPQFVASLDASFRGYWPVFFSDGDGLYILNVASGLMMAADITEAVDPAGTGEITKIREYVASTSNATYPVFQDQHAFIHNYKVDMTKFIAGDPNPIALELDEYANNLDTSQMSLPLGNLWLTGGYHKGSGSSERTQGMGVWVQQQAPDTNRPTVSYHIPQAGRANYPRHAPLSFLIHEVPMNGGPVAGEDFLVRRVNADETLGSSVPGHTYFDMSGVLTFTPDAGLDANATYQVDFIADSTNGKGFRDAAGNYIEPYSFRFSTGSAVAGDPPPTIDSITASDYQPEPGENFSVTVNATTTGLAEFRFNFDGEWGSWGTSNSASFSYPEEGRYRVLVQVRDDSGYTTTDSLRILTITPPTGPFATASSTMAVGDDGGSRQLLVVNPDSDTVTLLDAATGGKLDEHPVGANPHNIARDGNGRYWVSCRDSDEMYVLEANGGQLSTHLVLDAGYGSAPTGVCASPDGGYVYVAHYNREELLRYDITDPMNPAVVASVPTPFAIAVSGDGSRVFVTRFISAEMVGEVGEYESNGSTFQQKRIIRLEYSQKEDSGDRAAGVPNYLAGIAISPDGGHALVTGKQDNVLRGDFFQVGDLNHENTVRAIVSTISLSSNKELIKSRRDFDNSEGPSAVAFTPLGDTALISLRGNNRIVGFDSMDLDAWVNNSATIAVDAATGLAPQGVLVDPVSNRIFAQNFMTRSVTVLDGQPLLGENRTILPEIVETSTVATERLTGAELNGKQIFYNAGDERMSAEGYISCATCHIDGGHDGRVWDFHGRGEGFRRTTDLRGRAGLGHGNVHWSANFDEIQDFEHDIRGPFSGTGLIETLTPAQFAAQHPDPSTQKAGLSQDLDDLAAYVTSLATADIPRSPYRNLDGTMTAEALNGKGVFDSLNCATCHSGPGFTDSQVGPVTSAALHDVGTLTSFSGSRLGGGPLAGVDTPTLLGLHASTGYLHHGFAPTIEDVFHLSGGTYFEAEDATEVWTLNDVVSRQSDDPSDGGGGYARGGFAAGWMQVKTDKEDANNNGVLDPGEDSNGNQQLDVFDSGIALTGVDGGSGGLAQLSVRYISQYGNGQGNFRVNGTDNVVTLLRQQTKSGWKKTGWRWITIYTTLNPGTNNTIELLRLGKRDISFDAVVVANVDDLSVADPHRQILALASSEQDALLSWLEQLDGRDPDGNLPQNGAFLESGGLVSMEAENAHRRVEGTGAAAGITWQDQADTSASGELQVTALPNASSVNMGEGSNGARLDFDVEFATPGTYRIHVRMRGPNGSDDSVRLGVDGVILTTGGIGVTTGTGWAWRSASSTGVTSEFAVDAPGPRTISVWMRENGTPVDKVVVTTGSTPTGLGPAESPRGGSLPPQGETSPIDFGSAASFSGFGGSQDQGEVLVSSDGGTNNVANFYSNTWKQFAHGVTVGAETRVSFSMKVTGKPEIVAIALGDSGDTTINNIQGQGVQLYGDGSQDTWFSTSAKNSSVATWYDGSDTWVSYDILVTDFATQGAYSKIVFVADDDNGQESSVYFKDLRFYEP